MSGKAGQAPLPPDLAHRENPSLSVAPIKVLVPPDSPGAGGSVLLLQKWLHEAAAWSRLPVAEQERVMGRSKADSVELADGVELADRPETSHVARTDQDEFGTIFRCNTPFGTAVEHGTMFVGFSATQRPLTAMLESMAGITTGQRDALTYYARATTDAYYLVPALDDLNAFSTTEE
jgi:porphyrinogen peroxidase